MQKRTLIRKIQRIIEEYGQLNACELELDSFPVIKDVSENAVQLAESFNMNDAKAVLYVNSEEVDEEYIEYKDLKKDVLEEIYFALEQYDNEFQKTIERCKS